MLAHCVAVEYASKKKMRKDLCGSCMISAFALYEAMKKNDKEHGTAYNPRLVVGVKDNAIHAWVESDEDVYDPTYLQFGGKPFHVGPPTEWHNYFSQRIMANWETFKNVESGQKPTKTKVKNFVKRMVYAS